MFKRALAADFKRVRFLHLYALCAAFSLAVALVYLFAHDGAWMAAPLTDGGVWGFSANPGIALGFAGDGFSAEEALANAALAHTIFFPLLALFFLYRLYFGEVHGGASLSFARGMSRPSFFGAKLVAASAVLQGCYLAMSLVAFAAYAIACQPESLAPVAEALAGKAFVCCLVNESFIAFCLTVFSWVRSGPVAAGVIFVATIAGLVAQMSFSSLDVPVHMAWWMRACGLVASPALVPTAATYSALSFALFAAASYGGLIRQLRR